MYNDDNKTAKQRKSPIFTVPACGFVVALNLEWLDDVNTSRAALQTGETSAYHGHVGSTGNGAKAASPAAHFERNET